MDKLKNIPDNFLNWETDTNVLLNFFKWIRHESKCKTLTLQIDNDLNDLKTEIMSKIFLAVNHREDDSKGWKSLTLHGYSSLMTESDDFYRTKDLDLPERKEWTSISKFFPKTKEWILKNIPFDNYGRIRIMIIEPGGFVLPHRDFKHGNLLAGINVAITHPLEVEYLVNDESIEWKEGESRLIDIGSIHSINNNSNLPRVHLIIHSEPIDQWSDKIMKIVCKSYIENGDCT